MNNIKSRIVCFITFCLLCSVGVAATSSLPTYKDYRYTVPNLTNNISGKVMGLYPTYRILRSEDIAFLYEAYTELDLIWNIAEHPIWHNFDERPYTGIDYMVLHPSSFSEYEWSYYDEPMICQYTINSCPEEGYNTYGGIVDDQVLLKTMESTIPSDGVDAKVFLTQCTTLTTNMSYKLPSASLKKWKVPKIATIVSNFSNVATAHGMNVINIEQFSNGSHVYLGDEGYLITTNETVAYQYKHPRLSDYWTWNAQLYSFYNPTNEQTVGEWSKEPYEVQYGSYDKEASSGANALYKSKCVIEHGKASGSYRDVKSQEDIYSVYGHESCYSKSFTENYSEWTNNRIIETGLFVTNDLYGGKGTHIKNFNSIDGFLYFQVKYTTCADDEVAYWSNGERKYVSGTPTNEYTSVFVPVKFEIVPGRNSPGYWGGELYVVNPSGKHFMNSKDFCREYFRSGMYSPPGDFVNKPNAPSEKDIPSEHLSVVTYDNTITGYKEFTIYLRGILLMIDLQYYSTFSDEE